MEKQELVDWISNNLVTKSKRIPNKRLLDIPKNIEGVIIDYTSFLIEPNIKDRVYCILSGETKHPLCVNCGVRLGLYPKYLKSIKKHIITDRKYCSKDCNQYSSIAKNKREQTILDTYGNVNIFATKLGKEKVKKSNLILYNCENPQQNKEIRKKTEQTLIEKYGGIGTASKSIQEKVIKTHKEKTGYNFPGEVPENIEKIKQTHRDNHGCYFNQKHILHENIEKLHNVYWVLEQNFKYGKPVIQIAKELGITPRILHKVLKECGYACNKYFIVSIEEKEVQDFISSLDVNFITNNRTTIKPKELDIYIPDCNLAIEYNGLYSHSELPKRNSTGRDKNYHLNKTNLCSDKNIQLIHIFSNEWVNKKDIVKSIIRSKLNKLENKIYARKCKIKEVSNIDSRNFLNNNHLQGHKNSKIKLGLYFEEELVSLMTFSKRQKNYDWELDRFCNKLNISVVGGASKLFKNFLKLQYPFNSVLTYADIKYSNGNLYEQLGFSLDHISSPNYWYTKDYKELESRIKYQKHKLKDLLEDFDPELTEIQNMNNNGFDRIFDCGNLVYTIN